MAEQVGNVVEAEATSTTDADTTPKTAAPAKAAAKPAVAAKPQEAEAAKAAAEKPVAKKEAAKSEAESAAPEKPAALVFNTPEGEPIKGPVIEAFAAMANEHKWTQDVADEQLGRLSQSLRDARTAMTAEWEKELRADKEFGGDKFEENVGAVKTAVERLGGADFFKFLVDSGLERNPPTMRFLLGVSKAISADKFTAGVKVTGRPGDIPNPSDTSVSAFAKKYATPAKP